MGAEAANEEEGRVGGEEQGDEGHCREGIAMFFAGTEKRTPREKPVCVLRWSPGITDARQKLSNFGRKPGLLGEHPGVISINFRWFPRGKGTRGYLHAVTWAAPRFRGVPSDGRWKSRSAAAAAAAAAQGFRSFPHHGVKGM